MTKAEHVQQLTKQLMDRYAIHIPLEKLPWSGEFVETKLNTGEIQLVDRMVEFALCKMFAKYFIDRYCWVFDPQGGPIPFRLFDFQEDILDDFQKHSKIIFRKSRQVGASVMSGAFATWRANFNKAQIIRIISLTREDALEFKEKTVDLNYYELPGFLKAKSTRDGYSKTKLKLVNQSQIRVLSKSKNAGRGSTPSLIILDEAAFNEWMDDIWKSLEPSLDKGGDCIVISTTNGVGNWYHVTYSNAEASQNEFHPIYIPWWRYPGRSNPWLDDLLVKIKKGEMTNEEIDKFVKTKEREQLSYQGSPENAPWLWKRRSNAKTDKEFRQEILAEFLGSGETVTTVKTINRLQEEVRPPEWEDRLPSDPIQSPIPGLWVWKDVEPGHDYMLTSDTATGHGKDYSTMQIIDINENEQVAEYKNQIPTDKMGELIKKVARYYNNAFVIIETNHPGPAVFNEVYKSKIDPYQNVYARARGKDIVGWMTTPKTRVLLVEAYFKDVENAYTHIHSSRLVDEIKVFNWNDSGKAEAMRGYNDDLIMAYSFYCHLKQEAFTAKPIGFATADTNLTHIGQNFEEDWYQVERDFEENIGMDMVTYHWLQGKPLPDNYKEFIETKRKEARENAKDKFEKPPDWLKARVGIQSDGS